MIGSHFEPLLAVFLPARSVTVMLMSEGMSADHQDGKIARQVWSVSAATGHLTVEGQLLRSRSVCIIHTVKSSREIIHRLTAEGWVLARTKGSHHQYKQARSGHGAT